MELHLDGVAQLRILIQHFMVHGVAVDDNAAQIPDGIQGAGLAGTRTAGNADNHLFLIRRNGLEACRLFQAVADGQSQPLTVRTLGIDLLNILAVKGAEGVKHPLGLNPLVPAGAEALHRLPVEPVSKLIEADHAVSGLCQLLNGAGRRLRRAGNHSHRRFRRIMAVLHAGGLGLFAILEGFGHSLVHRQGADHLLQRLQRHPAGSEQAGWVAGQIHNGGLHAHLTGAAVHHGVDLALHVLHHVRCGGAAGTAGGIGAGRGHRNACLPDDGQRYLMVRAADTHGVQSRCGGVRHDGLPLQDHGQRTGPEFPGQRIRQRRHVLTVPGQPLGSRNMDDERVVLRTALGLEDLVNSLCVQCISTQTVDRFRGNSHQSPLPQDVCRCGDLILDDLLLTLGVPQVKISCMHHFSPRIILYSTPPGVCSQNMLTLLPVPVSASLPDPPSPAHRSARPVRRP